MKRFVFDFLQVFVFCGCLLDEEEIWKHRAQLYRYDDSETPGQWKQRGTGVVKLLKHKELGKNAFGIRATGVRISCTPISGYVRLLMRRDTTLKVCANHYILPYFELRPHDKADRAWVWRTPSDFADEEQKPETLAIRFKVSLSHWFQLGSQKRSSFRI